MIDCAQNRRIAFYQSLVFLAFFLVVGCGTGSPVYKISLDEPIQFSRSEKLDCKLELRLNDQLCSSKALIANGLPYYADFGETFCENTKNLANSLFGKVVVTKGNSNGANPDLILTPEILAIEKVNGKFASDMITITMLVRWTFTDPQGEIVWVDTMEGTGMEKMGGPFSYKKNSIKQVRLALENVFQDTFTAIDSTSRYLKIDSNPDNPYQHKEDAVINARFRPYIEKQREIERKVKTRLRAYEIGKLTEDEFRADDWGSAIRPEGGFLGIIGFSKAKGTTKYILGKIDLIQASLKRRNFAILCASRSLLDSADEIPASEVIDQVAGAFRNRVKNRQEDDLMVTLDDLRNPGISFNNKGYTVTSVVVNEASGGFKMENLSNSEIRYASMSHRKRLLKGEAVEANDTFKAAMEALDRYDTTTFSMTTVNEICSLVFNGAILKEIDWND